MSALPDEIRRVDPTDTPEVSADTLSLTATEEFGQVMAAEPEGSERSAVLLGQAVALEELAAARQALERIPDNAITTVVPDGPKAHLPSSKSMLEGQEIIGTAKELVLPPPVMLRGLELEPSAATPVEMFESVVTDKDETPEGRLSIGVEPVVLTEPLIVPQFEMTVDDGKTRELLTIDDVLSHVDELVQLAVDQQKDEPEVAQVLAGAQDAAQQLAAELLTPAEGSLFGETVQTDFATTSIGSMLDRQMEQLLPDVELADMTAEELMVQLKELDDELAPNLQQLLVVVTSLLEELGVQEPTAQQVISLAKALVIRAVQERVLVASAEVQEDIWTHDKSIAHERYGLFGAWRVPVSLGSTVPIGRFALWASLARA